MFEKFNRLRHDNLIVTNDELNKKTKKPIGIPQGSALSALLSNIYLIDYDQMMLKKAKEEGFLYRRYCDDIMIVCKTEKANEIQSFAINEIHEKYNLTIQDKKVETIDFMRNTKGDIRSFRRLERKLHIPIVPTKENEKRLYKNLQYLGFEFDGQTIFIRSSSLSRYYRKMKARISKTVSMAYGSNAKSNRVFKRQLFERYAYLGRRNFLTYAQNAASEKYKNSKGEYNEGMNSTAITKQIRKHFEIIIRTLTNKNLHRHKYKSKKGKAVIRKSV